MDEFGKFDTQMLGITEDQIVEVDASEAEVVSRVLTPRVKDIVVTFRPDGITFNTTCVRSMKDVVFIQMYIDRKKQKMYVSPSMEYEKNSKQWCTVKNGSRLSRKITGRGFGNLVYNVMDWSKGYSYRVIGYPARQQGTEDEYMLVFDLDVYNRSLLTEKGLSAAGVEDKDLGEDAERIHADIAEAQAQKEKAREEAKATGKKRGRRKKVEYYDEVANGAFGPKKKDYNPRVEVPTLDQLEIVGADGQLEMAVADEEEQGAQVSESARLQDGSKTEDTVHASMEQPDPTKDTPPIPSL